MSTKHRTTFALRLFAVFSLVSFVACSSSPKSAQQTPVSPLPQHPEELKPLQGTWVVVHNEIRKRTLPQMNGALFIFHNDGFRLGDDPPGYERFAVDPGHTPKWIDFDVGDPLVIRGIYEIKGDELTICTAEAGKPRPTAFETSRSTGTVLTKVKRR